MLVTLEGMVTEVRPLQPEKTEEPMLVTVLGMAVFLQPAIRVLLAVSIMALQLLRESYFVLPFATLMLVRPLQPEKTELPMEVTELGMMTLVRPLQP